MSNSMSSKAAVNAARTINKKVSHLSLKTLFPIPEAFLKDLVKPYKRIIIPEVNETGQYADLIKHLFTDKELIKLNSIAKAIKPKDILEAVL
jgi:pyruvate/2-oxoacid:ferredoxin oxidoreductase alpha subunit